MLLKALFNPDSVCQYERTCRGGWLGGPVVLCFFLGVCVQEHEWPSLCTSGHRTLRTEKTEDE